MKKSATTAAAKTTTKKTAKKATEVVTKGPDRTHKICSVCKLPQPLDMFYRPAKDCRCKACNATYAKDLKARKAEAAAQAETVKPAVKKAAAKKTPTAAPKAKKGKKAA